MSGADEPTLAAITTRTLELVQAADPAAEAEVSVDGATLGLTRFANSVIHQNVAEEMVSVRVKVHSGGRTTSGSSTLTDDEGIRRLVARTLDAARVAPPDPGWPGVAPPEPLVPAVEPDGETVNATADDRVTIVGEFVDAADGLETAGYCRTSAWSSAFANTAGQRVSATGAEAALDGIARHDGSDGVARLAANRVRDLDGAVLGARAAAKALGGADPVEWPPGRYQVVLESAAVVDLLQGLAAYGFGGRAVNDNRSFVEVGAGQFDPSITIVDDAPATGSLYDMEGTPQRRAFFVERGATSLVAHDRRTAREAGGTSTGHASGSGAWGPFPRYLCLLAGGREPGSGSSAVEVDGPVADAATADLVDGVERGVLVSDLWYTRVLDPKALTISGLTRNGLWAIENGEVTRPLTNFRFTQSYATALAPDAVLGIGQRVVAVPDRTPAGRWTAPAVHLRSWNFTGGASG